jgi:DNA modification methylase
MTLKGYKMLELNKIYCMDNIEGMRLLDDNSIDLTVTSPPYDNLRNYNGYNFDFENVAKELYRTTKLGGVVVWVVGDATIKGSETGTSFRQALYFKEVGFNLHDTMIYEKAGFRYPDAIRYNAVFEYMFIFSKGKPKTFNPIKDKINLYAGGKVARQKQTRQVDGTITENSAWRNNKDKRVNEVGTRNNIWKLSSGKQNALGQAHPAAFPEELAEGHIISWSNPGDIVLDPFLGSGTTSKVAKLTNRNFIGFDISQEYCNLAEQRLQQIK